MWMARLLARTAAVVVPLGGGHERRLARARAFLAPLPWWLRALLGATLLLVWALASVARRGQNSRDAAVARWLEVFISSPARTPYLLAQLVKLSSCLVVVGDPEVRRSLYAAHRLSLPSQVATERTPPMSVAILNGRKVADVADFVVVGSGPAGATVARTLAKAGREVVLLEEGPAVPAAWAAQDTIENLHARFRSMGTVTSAGPERIPVLQGRCVGGSSVINSAIAWRAPEMVFAPWHDDPDLAKHLSLARLERAYAAVEADIGIETTREAVFGPTNTYLAAAARAIGVPGQPTDRYTHDCAGLGRCMEGCPLGRKLSMNVTFVPDAVAAGARLYSDCRVEQVEFEGARAVGVRARTAQGVKRFLARRAVVVAASAVQTPLLLRDSGIAHPQLGRRFQAHPGGSMAALFPRPVRDVLGATQGYEVPYEAKRIKVEVLTLPDELSATRFPGVGARLASALGELPYMALWGVLVRARAHGSVGGTPQTPVVRFRFTRQDELTLGEGLRSIGELYFAAGARVVFPNIRGFNERVTDAKELAPLSAGVAVHRINSVLTHMFGTAVMGSDAKAHVCDAFGRVHGVQGLVVADSSLFPTNLGVNPQHTIMAVAQHVGWGLLDA